MQIEGLTGTDIRRGYLILFSKGWYDGWFQGPPQLPVGIEALHGNRIDCSCGGGMARWWRPAILPLAPLGLPPMSSSPRPRISPARHS